MSGENFENTEYEIVTQFVYQTILDSHIPNILHVIHNADLEGQSGQKHQIDVHYSYALDSGNTLGIVLIECKNYGDNLNVGLVRNFFGALHDIKGFLVASNPDKNIIVKGVMVTKVGYQSGAKKYADYYNIELLCLNYLELSYLDLLDESEFPKEISLLLDELDKDGEIAVSHPFHFTIESKSELLKILHEGKVLSFEHPFLASPFVVDSKLLRKFHLQKSE